MNRPDADPIVFPAIARCLAALTVCLSLFACSDHPTTTDSQTSDSPRELHIATIESSTTYFRGKHGRRGFEHDLARAFAHYVGATPRFIVAHDQDELVALIRSGKADIAAAHVTIRDTPPSGILFGPTYMTTRPLVVYRRGSDKPQTFAALRGKRLAASDTLDLRATLESTLRKDAGYLWPYDDGLPGEEMLALVEDGEIDYAIMASTEFEALQRFYPETQVAFEFGAPSAIAWLYSADQHFELRDKQLEFLRALRANGALAGMAARYFSTPREFDYVQSRDFLEHYAERLPAFRKLFEHSAVHYKLDWLLLAAMSYQESHWRKDATSPTGVRGLMMLTAKTAAALDVDRLDPHSCIRGGAEYLAMLKSKLPERIEDADRTWLALAAYNIGIGNLERARVLTAKAGRNADSWDDVRRFLPRVSIPTAVAHARLSARGNQAVHFVDNTRRYYETLRWLEGDLARGTVAAATSAVNSLPPVL